jgi:hypothetical protein
MMNAKRPFLLLVLLLCVGCKSPDKAPPRSGPDARPGASSPTSAASIAAPSGPRRMPDRFPRVGGQYVSTKQHPRVYETQADLDDMAKRINTPGSFSAQRFDRLAKMVEKDLATKTDWDASYAGCDIYVYLHAFSVEAMAGYSGQTRSEDELAKALNVPPGATPPIGAVLVASRLALYAALAKAGAKTPTGAPSASQATAVAKRILLAWADHGFREANGHIRDAAAQYCENGKPAKPVAIALQISRGIVYSVQAHDLLAGVAALSADEAHRLEAFHTGMYDALRAMANEEYTYNVSGSHGDEVYNNQFATHVTALIAIARLLDDSKRLEAALDGGSAELEVELPWTKLFSYVIYGVDDAPLTRITPNSNEDPLKSSPAYSTKVVAPGEINDRFRNATPDQGIGYPMGTLGWFYMSAEALRIAGYDPYGYRGTHKQSIEGATEYYVCYANAVGFDKTVTADNAKSCPDYQQYIGKMVVDVQSAAVIGAYRFPKNAAITKVESAAKEVLAPDTIRFGRWAD